MSLIGGRWKPAIMFALIMQGPHRFSALMRTLPGVSQRMLTKQLRDLEANGFVRREVRATSPIQVEYSATELGASLHQIYKAACDWADEHWNERGSAGA